MKCVFRLLIFTRETSRCALMMHLRIFLIIVVLLSATSLSPVVVGRDRASLSGDASSLRRSFEPAEELYYEGEFSKLLLRGIKIAEFKFSAKRTPAISDVACRPTADTSALSLNHADAPLLFTGQVESKGWFRKLFGINFRYHVESIVDPNTFSILRTTKLDEQGTRVRASEAIFDRTQNKIAWIERDPNDAASAPRIVNSPLRDAAHDIISAVYFLRTQTLTPGKSFDLAISDSGAVYHVPAKVLAEPKKMKSVLGKVSVVRVDIEVFGKERLVDGDGKMSLWVTDDTRHIPVRARLINDLGTIDVTLKKVGR